MKKLDEKTLRQHKGISFVGISTVFFCHDGNGKFLMSKRSKNTRDEQGKWEIPGGGLKWGSTAIDNVKREVKEELGANPKEISLMGYRDVFRTIDGAKTHWLMIDFCVLVDPKEVMRNELDNADEIGWFTLDEQPSPVHSQHKKLMKKYKDYFSKVLGDKKR